MSQSEEITSPGNIATESIALHVTTLVTNADSDWL